MANPFTPTRIKRIWDYYERLEEQMMSYISEYYYDHYRSSHTLGDYWNHFYNEMVGYYVSDCDDYKQLTARVRELQNTFHACWFEVMAEKNKNFDISFDNCWRD